MKDFRINDLSKIETLVKKLRNKGKLYFKLKIFC